MKSVVFDMDGVIFDSERATHDCWMEIARRHGFDGDLDVPYMKCIGVNAQMTKDIFFAHYGADFPYEEYRMEESKLYHETYDGGRLPLKKGIREILSWLKENGYDTAVASSTRSAVVLNQLRDAGLEKYFDRIIGGDMVTKSKPEPDIFLKALEGTDAKIGETIVIEDSFNGIRAAKNAGMLPVMVPDMIPPDDEMREKAILIAKDLGEVLAWLKGREIGT